MCGQDSEDMKTFILKIIFPNSQPYGFIYFVEDSLRIKYADGFSRFSHGTILTSATRSFPAPFTGALAFGSAALAFGSAALASGFAGAWVYAT